MAESNELDVLKEILPPIRLFELELKGVHKPDKSLGERELRRLRAEYKQKSERALEEFRQHLKTITPRLQSPEKITLRLSDYKDLSLKWNGEREEWVGVGHEFMWYDFVYSEYFTYSYGPFALDEKYAQKILEAYHISEGKIPSEQVLRTEPSELEKIARAPLQKK